MPFLQSSAGSLAIIPLQAWESSLVEGTGCIETYLAATAMAGIVQSSSRIQSPPIPSISGRATAVVPNGSARVASGACRIPRQRGQTTSAGLAVSPLAAVTSTAVELLAFGASMSIDSDAGNGSRVEASGEGVSTAAGGAVEAAVRLDCWDVGWTALPTPVSAAVDSACTMGAVLASRIAVLLGSAALQGGKGPQFLWLLPIFLCSVAGYCLPH